MSSSHESFQEVGASGAMAVPNDPRTGSRTVGYLFYLPAAVLFALNGTISKQLLVGGVEATRLSQFRVTAAFAVLAVVVAISRPRALRLARKEIPLILLYGVAGVLLTQWLYFVSISRLPVGVSLLIEFTAPVMVALWVRFAWHQPVRDRVWGALALAMLGLAMVGQVWSGITLDLVGVIAGFGAAAALAVYYLTGERAVVHRDPISLTMWGMGAAALAWALVLPWWSFPWGSVSAVAGQVGPLTGISGWWLAAYMVVLGTVVPFVLVLASLRYLSAAQASVVGMTEPVIASAIAWVVLGEVLTPVQVLGAIVVLAGVLLAESSR